MHSTAPWQPSDIEDYKRFYSAPADLSSLVSSDISQDFVALWSDQAGCVSVPRHTTFVLVRGLFGGWMPGHFAAPCKRLRQAGFSLHIANSNAAGTISDNANLIGRDLERHIPSQHQIIFLCHSKGGLDTLAMLARFPHLMARTSAIVLCQTPRAGCPVLESVLLNAFRSSYSSRIQAIRERIASATISMLRARAACLDLTGENLARWIARLDAVPCPCPLISVASWSQQPSAILDSQHGRMQQIWPGRAHDGLFLLESMIWPTGKQVLLAEIDHSQPTVGGAQFDHGRFWLALARLAIKNTLSNHSTPVTNK